MSASVPTSARPVALVVQWDNIPDELKSLKQWVISAYTWVPPANGKPGKWDKPPLRAQLARQELADVTKPETWTNFGAVRAVYENQRPDVPYDFPGFVPAPSGPYTLVDLDDCADRDTGALDEWAAEIVRDFDSYTELSPSGTGLRIITRSAWPWAEKQGTRRADIEMYHGDHYLTITGQHLEGTPWTIEQRDAQVAALYERLNPPAPQASAPHSTNGYHPAGSDEQIEQKARLAENGPKFVRLFELGDIGDYPSGSEADMGLVGLLAFWTRDAAQIERIMRRSALRRPKWDCHKKYLQNTIDKVLRQPGERYDWTAGVHIPPHAPHHSNGRAPHEDAQPPGEGAAAAAGEQPPDLRSKWKVKLISECGDGETRDWHWQGYAGPGMVTTLTALWKSGKTTLLSHLLKAFGDAEEAQEEGKGAVVTFAGQPVKAARVLVVTEEDEGEWAARRVDLGLKDSVEILSRPFMGKPSPVEWADFLADVGAMCSVFGYELVIIDTVFNLWCVTDENDNAQVISALQPTRSITAAGAALLLVTHPNKSGQGQGKATRGAGAWGGFADVLLEMTRFEPENTEDTRRVIRAFARSSETPAEVVLDYDPANHTYSVIGTKSGVRQDVRRRALLEQLPDEAPGVTAKLLYEKWDAQTMGKRPSSRSIESDLKWAVGSGLVLTTGTGAPRKPYQYYRAGGARQGWTT